MPNRCAFCRHSRKRKVFSMIFQEAMFCSGRSKRNSDAAACGFGKSSRHRLGALLQASGRGRGQERRANGAECSDGGHGLIRSRRTGGGTESDGCFPLFTPCRNAFLPAADSFAMEDPASCSEALPARSSAIRCREGVRLQARPARAEVIGRLANTPELLQAPANEDHDARGASHKFLPAIEDKLDSETHTQGTGQGALL